MFKAAIVLAHQYNISIGGEFIRWQVGQSTGAVIDVVDVVCHALSTSNIVGIVGPYLSREAEIIAPFAQKIGIPVISYSATDPDLSNRNVYPNFYRTVPSDDLAALALVKLFIRFNWTSCTVIYQNDAFGLGGVRSISNSFNASGLAVKRTVEFDIATLSIRGNLKSLLTNAATRIVVLWAISAYTPLILQDALDSNVVGPYFTWILSSAISINYFNETYYQNLIGMLSIEPVTGSVVNALINTTLLDAAYSIWQQYEPESFPESMNVDYYALFAFDATWTLIQSLQKMCASKINNSSSCLSFFESSYCFNCRFVQSNLLLDAVTRTEFLGISGPIQFSYNVTNRITGLYYTAKNTQPSSNGVNFVHVLDYSHPGDWRIPAQENIIVWSGNSLTKPTGQASLKGVNLRIGIIESVPFLIVDNAIDASGQTIQEYSGYILDLIDILQSQLGFIPILQLAPSTMTYNGLIQAVKDGIYDIVVADITVTAARREVVSFSNPIYDNALCIVMRQTRDISIDLFAFLKPFALNLWLVALATLIYAGMIMWFVERHNNEELENRSVLSQIVLSIWYCFGNVVGFGVDFPVRTSPGRLLTLGLYILGLILVSSYTANLASELTIAKSTGIISGIQDLKNGKIPLNRIDVLVQSAHEEYYLRKVSNGARTYYPVHSEEELCSSVAEGLADASIIDSSSAEYYTNNIYCNLTIVGDYFNQNIYSIVIPQDWIYTQDLDVTILSLRQLGELDKLRIKWFQTKRCPDSLQQSGNISIEEIFGLFLVFGVISILSLLLFAWMKRHNVKSYLFKLMHKKELSAEKNGFENRHSNETVGDSQHHQHVSLDICVF
ncbi:unnamed protein product [Rotaria sp. Silwood1]|nr:unnamed protein product [Rotaria sp. Silwood1]CAF4963709.1 unnamed protein product [Rotaria sp. Silwood1]